MRYANIRSLDISNGEGIGISLFVQGCHFHCPNCFNSETWDFDGGYEWTSEIQDNFLNLANKPYIKRISILGGEPLADENLSGVLILLEEIKKRFNNDKKIWLYTGYYFNDIMGYAFDDKRFKIVSLCDVLIDGRYVDSLRDYKLKWRGSINQSVIDVNETLKSNKIKLYCE